MIKLFDFWNTLAKAKPPDSKSFLNLKKGIDNPLTVAKLCFFSFLARLLQPFLTAFQGDGPMLPYLCSSIKELVVSLLGLIVRPKVIEEAQTLALVKLVQNEKNLVETKKCPSWVCSWKWVTKLFKMWKGWPGASLNPQKGSTGVWQNMHWKSSRGQFSYVHSSLQFWSGLPESDGYKKSWFGEKECQGSSSKNCDFKTH